MKLNLVITLILSTICGLVNAQEKLELSLQEAVERAKSKNYDVRQAMAEMSAAQGQYRKTNSVFLPSVELSENYVTTNDPLTAFGFKLKQEITNQEDFNPEKLNNPDRIENFNTRLEVLQPLINADGFAQRSAVKKFYDASEKSYERQLQYVTYQIKQSYYDLWLAQQKIRTVSKSLEAARHGYQLAHDNLQAGYILESDLIAAELHVLDLETKLEQAKAAVSNANEQLKYLLGIDENIIITPTDSLKSSPLPAASYESISVPSDRVDLEALDLRVAGQRAMHNASKFQYLPNLNLMGSYEFNDDALFGTDAENYLLGISLKWKLFNGYKRMADVQINRATLEKTQLQKDKVIAQQNKALKNAQNQMSIAYNQFKTSELAAQRAEKLYQIKEDRYKEGLEKTADLINAESDLYQKRMDRLNALYQYNINIYTIEFLLGHEVQ